MTPKRKIWTLTQGDSPLVATAVHDGHNVRPEIASLLALSDDQRLREEDPHTGPWTDIAPNRLIATHSRFQVDLNRPRAKAVYRTPEDAWGLRVWRREIPDQEVLQSLTEYDAFYSDAEAVFERLRQRFGRFFVFDLHSYNHRRPDPDSPPADPEANPEVNIGTGTMDREHWAPLVDCLIRRLREFDFLGRRLDVRENVKFRGGNFSRWIHETFPTSGCAVAIEFKKFFMDEWSGELDPVQHRAIREALRSAVPALQEILSGYIDR